MIKVTPGLAIASKRMRQAISEPELANAAKISTVRLGRIEKGRAVPTSEEFESLAQYLGTSIDELENPQLNSLRDAIDFRMAELGLCVGSLAKKVCASHFTVYGWTTYGRPPTEPELDSLADALKLPAFYLGSFLSNNTQSTAA